MRVNHMMEGHKHAYLNKGKTTGKWTISLPEPIIAPKKTFTFSKKEDAIEFLRQQGYIVE